MIFRHQINALSQNPKKIFLVDGSGAILSAFFLGVVLVKWKSIFGIPPSTLYFLALLPCLFAAYDFLCYCSLKTDPRAFLKWIAYANLMYCCISLASAGYHHNDITNYGWLYILAEILILAGLSYFEIKVANRPKS